jgi:Flp pilus assembly pilin Flp
MFNQIKSFAANESGAVTVDWVVLVAGLIGLAIAAMTAITNTTRDLTAEANTKLDEVSVNTTLTK